MFRTKRKRVGIAELCLVALILIMSAGMLMACVDCEDGLFPIQTETDANGETESGEIEFETRTASPALQFAIIAVMILILGGVIYVIFRKSGQKNLSRQQKRALNKQQEKKQNKNNNRKNNSGKTNATAPKKKSKNKRKK